MFYLYNPSPNLLEQKNRMKLIDTLRTLRIDTEARYFQVSTFALDGYSCFPKTCHWNTSGDERSKEVGELKTEN